jgi:hypothetical protein
MNDLEYEKVRRRKCVLIGAFAFVLVGGSSAGSANDEPTDRHGIIHLNADSAELVGERLKLTDKGDARYISDWETKREYVKWSFETRRPGRYLIVVEYAVPLGRQGATFEVEIEGQVRGATAQATGAVDRFLPQPLKDAIELKSGSHELEIRAVEIPKSFVMNLAKLRLVPAEGEDAY